MNLNVVKLLFIFISSFQSVYSAENAPIVKTLSGQIRGSYRYSSNKQIYRAFEGIPYAKPPVGNLRFEAPVSIEPWQDVLDATKNPKVCAQFDMFGNRSIGEEDCLYLNLYTPYTGRGPLLPVIFRIHGGAFQLGSSVFGGPRFFDDSFVVYVNINYRVGPFGFLSTGDESMPGNYGLKDQNAALRWVVKNIQFFGGDPKRITLQGCSAGGASVHYHYLSPMSRGLFQNGISMSGSALSPWAFTKTPMDETKKVAHFVNCPTTDSKTLVACLKKLTAKKLTDAASEILNSEYLSWSIDRPLFRPVAENIEKGYFINRSPTEILKSGDVYNVPWVVGVNSEEGIIFTRGLLMNQTRLSYADKNWEKVGAYLMHLQDELPKERHSVAANKARKHYLGDKPLKVDDYDALLQLIHLTGDKSISFNSEKAAVLQANVTKSPVRLYYYNYRASRSAGNMFIGNSNVDFGVCHCDDEGILYEVFTTQSKDLAMQKKMLKMIYTFVLYGVPNFGIEWPMINSSEKYTPYMHISGPNTLYVLAVNNFAQKNFWNSLLSSNTV